MSSNPFPSITPASQPFQTSKPGSGTGYKPDALSSGAATEKPMQEANVPKTGSIVPSLLKLAMRRMPGFGVGMPHGAAPQAIKPANAFTMGSHGSLK
jgi:hypothetical protein